MELSLPLWFPWNSPIKLFKFCWFNWFCQTVFTTRHLPHIRRKSVIFFQFGFSLSFYMILIRWFILWFWSSLPHGTVFAFVIPWNSPIKLFKFCSFNWVCQTVFTTHHLPHMGKAHCDDLLSEMTGGIMRNSCEIKIWEDSSHMIQKPKQTLTCWS